MEIIQAISNGLVIFFAWIMFKCMYNRDKRNKNE